MFFCQYILVSLTKDKNNRLSENNWLQILRVRIQRLPIIALPKIFSHVRFSFVFMGHEFAQQSLQNKLDRYARRAALIAGKHQDVSAAVRARVAAAASSDPSSRRER